MALPDANAVGDEIPDFEAEPLTLPQTEAQAETEAVAQGVEKTLADA